MITELTQEQKDQMPKYAAKWINIGCDTSTFTYDEAVDIIHNLQEHILKVPKSAVFVFDNPIEAWVATNLSYHYDVPNDQLCQAVDDYFNGINVVEIEEFVSPYLTGSFDAAIFSQYDYYENVLSVDYQKAKNNYEIWKSTTKLGLIYPIPDKCVIVSKKPTAIHLNEDKLTHRDGGPAISYGGRGDCVVYALNGVEVPQWLAETHSSKIDIKRYHEITNADVRTEFVRKVGIERMLDFGKKIDSYKKYNETWWTKSEYEIYDMAPLFEGVSYAPHLYMLNQTTGVYHLEALSPDVRNLKDAMRDRFDGHELDIQAIA
jgi:hypothetical protein